MVQIITVCSVRWHQWLAWQHFFSLDIFCFIFQINLFFRYHVYFFCLQCIIKQLSDSVFVICKVINVSVTVISLTFGSADNSYLDIDSSAYHTKTLSNNCILLNIFLLPTIFNVVNNDEHCKHAIKLSLPR